MRKCEREEGRTEHSLVCCVHLCPDPVIHFHRSLPTTAALQPKKLGLIVDKINRYVQLKKDIAAVKRASERVRLERIFVFVSLCV